MRRTRRRRSCPVSIATGGWQDPSSVAELYVITTPHRVRLVARPPSGHAAASWNHAPLVGPDLLRQLTSPLMTRPGVDQVGTCCRRN